MTTTTDNKILAYLTAHDHATFADLHHHTDHRIADVREAIDRLEQHGTITHTKSPLPGRDTWALTTPDTPTTPTPPTIPTGHLILDPDDRRHVAWLTRELARAEGRDPSLMDAYRFEEDAVVVAKALRAMRDQQPAEDPASFEGENRATPSAARVVDAIAAGIGKRVGHDPETGDPRLEDDDARCPDCGYVEPGWDPRGPCTCPSNCEIHGESTAPRTELRQPSLDVAKAVVDELEARMRDRLRAWGLQCEASSSSDQETPR